MEKLFLGALVFLIIGFFSSAGALPVPPNNVTLDALETGIKISWAYPEQGFSFRAYKGNGFEDANSIAFVTENFFVDNNVEPNIEYFYFVTAIDKSGNESLPSNGYSVKWLGTKKTPPVFGKRDFNIEIAEPKFSSSTAFGFGETISIIVKVNSSRLSELKDVTAILASEELNLSQNFLFDKKNNAFSISIKLPKEEEAKALPITYTILASAYLENQHLLDTKEIKVFLVPKSFVNLEQFFYLLALAFIPLAILSIVAFYLFKWLMQRKTERNRMKLEILGILKQRAILKYDMMKNRMSPAQFAEKERELQGKQLALEKNLKKAGKGKNIDVKQNPFDGYTPAEIGEITMLVNSFSKEVKKMGKEGLMLRLLQSGKSERVAKKTVELVFQK